MIPGPIVVGEHQRPLVRAGREHDMLRPHLPEPLARQPGIRVREVIGEALLRREKVLVVIAERLRARQQRHTRRRPRVRRRALATIRRRSARRSAGLRLGEQRAAEFRLLVEQDDAGAGPRRGQRRRQARRAGADDRDFAMACSKP